MRHILTKNSSGDEKYHFTSFTGHAINLFLANFTFAVDQLDLTRCCLNDVISEIYLITNCSAYCHPTKKWRVYCSPSQLAVSNATSLYAKAITTESVATADYLWRIQATPQTFMRTMVCVQFATLYLPLVAVGEINPRGQFCIAVQPKYLMLHGMPEIFQRDPKK